MAVPKIWEETIDAHRRAVRDAILDAVAAHVADHGLVALRMSHLAKAAGVGRATLYGYFPDLDAVLVAWHEREVARHVVALEEIGARPGDPRDRIRAVLEAFAGMAHGHPHGSEVASLLHERSHVAGAQGRLHSFLRELILEGSATGRIRDDVPADELASFCLHAMKAAGDFRGKAATARFVAITHAVLLPPVAEGAENSRAVSNVTDR